MDLSDLFSLFEKNKEAACSLFIEKCSTKSTTDSDDYGHLDKQFGGRMDRSCQHSIIENFESLKKFLTYFGHLMEEFKIGCNENLVFKWNNVINLIHTHCTSIQTLNLFNNIDETDPLGLLPKTTMQSHEISFNPLKLTTTIFPQIHTLKIENIFFEPPAHLDACFPNLRSLELITVTASDPTFIEVHFPKLEHLGITLVEENYDYVSSDEEDNEHDDGNEEKPDDVADDDENRNQISQINIRNVLSLNPQLQSVRLEMEIDTSFMEFIKQTLPSLQTIDLSFGEYDFNNHHLKNDIVFETITSASLGCLGEKTPPILFKQLQELEFSTNAHKSTIEYIKRHGHLLSLHLACEYSDGEAWQMVKSLAKLKFLYIIIENNKMWSARGLIQFLAECERLDTLMLMVGIDETSQHNWRSLIADVWKIENGFEHGFVIEKIGKS